MSGGIVMMDPAELRISPLLKGMPMLGEEDPRFLALADSMLEHGFLPEPIKVEGGYIVDGRHRWRAAKRAGLTQVPCIEVPADQVMGIILGTLIHRRHFSKSALAYLAYPLLKGAHREAQNRRVAMLKSGGKPSISHSVAYALEDIADRLGISVSMFKYAAKVHEIFEADPDYKAAMEPRILGEFVGGEHAESRPVGLGAVVAGYAGRVTTKGEPKAERGQLELFTETFGTLEKRYEYWTALGEPEKRAAGRKIEQSLESMPDDLLERFEVAVRQERARRKKEGRGA